jgi:hypothetical protein
MPWASQTSNAGAEDMRTAARRRDALRANADQHSTAWTPVQLAENRYALAAKAIREVTPLVSTDFNGAATVDDSSHGRMLCLMVWSTATRQCAAALDPAADDTSATDAAALTVEFRWAATFTDLALVLGAFATADQQAHMLRLSARLLLQRNQLGDALVRATEAAACDHSVQSHALVALVQLAAGNTRGAQAAVRAITAALPPSDVADALVKVAKQAAGRGAWPVVLDAITAVLLHTDPASALSAAGGSWTLLSNIGVAAVSASDAVTASSLGLVCSIAVSLLRILPHVSTGGLGSHPPGAHRRELGGGACRRRSTAPPGASSGGRRGRAITA